MGTRSLKEKLVLSIVVFVAWGACGGAEEPKAKLGIGEKVADFSLPDVNGKTHSLYKIKPKKAVVLIFIGAKCPASNAFNQVMGNLAREYAKRGVTLVGISANKTDSVADLAEHARANSFDFRVLKDEGNVVADRLGARVTPEVFVLDKKRTLRYHGALGNSHTPTTKPELATDADIRPALEALLAGKPVPVAETKPFG